MAANNSDLILRCGGIKFEVHRATLCLKSPFFKVACYGEFREAKTRQIDLVDDDPDTVERMISYFYKDDYEDGNTKNLGINTYDITREKVHARHRSMLNDISVYAIADKYLIPDLKKLAISKFRSLAYSIWPHYDFPAIVILAYDSTPDNDEELRDTVATICARHFDDVLQDKSSSALEMKNIGIIGFDVAKKVKAISEEDFDYVCSTLFSVEEKFNEMKREFKSLFDSMCARCLERVSHIPTIDTA